MPKSKPSLGLVLVTCAAATTAVAQDATEANSVETVTVTAQFRKEPARHADCHHGNHRRNARCAQ